MNSILFALLGGALIGLSASAMLWLIGRVTGISGIFGGLLSSPDGDFAWRAAFISGLISGGLILLMLAPHTLQAPAGRSLPTLVVAGLLVGFGTRLGNGCTSGHGVCGLTRRSKRSLTATLTFMATGALTATGVRLLFGGVI